GGFFTFGRWCLLGARFGVRRHTTSRPRRLPNLHDGPGENPVETVSLAGNFAGNTVDKSISPQIGSPASPPANCYVLSTPLRLRASRATGLAGRSRDRRLQDG